MLKAPKTSTRWWVLMPLTGICFGMTLIVSGAVLAPSVLPILPCPGVSWTTTSGGFPLPVVRQSLNGLLQTTLHACISTNQMLDQNHVPPVTVEFHPPTFEGTIPAPTLSVKPGDKLSILLVNNLPANPPDERAGAFPHAENSINLHTHGLTVSPLGNSDNIFREMEPGTTNQVEIDIPQDHPSGTYWYHVHKHGSATYQFLGGMAGFLIVKGGPGTLDTVPEVAAAKDIPMAFQVVRSLNDGQCRFRSRAGATVRHVPLSRLYENPTGPTSIRRSGCLEHIRLGWLTAVRTGWPNSSSPSRFSYTTNGVANPTLQMQPGEVQRWRLLNATDGDNLQLVLVSSQTGSKVSGSTSSRWTRLRCRKPTTSQPATRW